MSRFEVDLVGMPEVQKMLSEFEGQKLQNRTRRALRSGAAVIRGPLRAAARSGRFPAKFKRTRTRAHRNPVGVSVSPGSPLSTIFEHGAKPHRIGIPTRNGVIPVQHPGMAARPLSGPVFDANRQKAEDAVRESLFEGL